MPLKCVKAEAGLFGAIDEPLDGRLADNRPAARRACSRPCSTRTPYTNKGPRDSRGPMLSVKEGRTL